MTDHPNTEATPSEVEAAARLLMDIDGYSPDAFDTMQEERNDYTRHAFAVLNAAYAIRLPPLYAELERYREALERLTIEARWVADIAEADHGMTPTSLRDAIDIAGQALQEQP